MAKSRWRSNPRRFGPSAVPALLVSLVLLLSPLAGATVFNKRFLPPYKGVVGITTTGTVLGSGNVSLTNASFFNSTQGVGGFAGSGAANSSYLAPQPFGPDTSLGEIQTAISVHLELPFKNLSGTRTLSSVSVSIRYLLSGSITLINGSCPWVRSLKTANVCERIVGAGASVQPEYMTYLNDYLAGTGPKKDYTYGTCPSGCDLGGVSGDSYSRNSSLGMTSKSFGHTNGTFSFTSTGTTTLVFTPATPVAGSRTLVIWFIVYAGVEAELQTKSGAGGLSGAYVVATLNFASLGNGFAVTSLVES